MRGDIKMGATEKYLINIYCVFNGSNTETIKINK